MQRVQTETKPPLRSCEEREAFFDRYFESVGARTVRSSEGYREYELPQDVDKELTDRPFYWMWVEKTGQVVPATVLRIAFTEEAAQRENVRLREEAFQRAEAQNLSEMERRFLRPPTAEYVTLGSFRLNKLYDSVDRRGQFACVHIGADVRARMVPWLVANVLVSFRCDLIEQRYVSYGICLENRQIVPDFFDKIKGLSARTADVRELLKPTTIPVEEAVRLLQRRVEGDLQSLPTDWATDAAERLHHDITRIHTYYDSLQGSDKSADEMAAIALERKKKLSEVEEKSAPRIEMAIKQLGLVGLPDPSRSS